MPKTMTRSHRIETALLLSATLLSACGGGDSTAPPTTGTLEFNVVTTGVDIDADGFALSVDGQPQVLPANGTVSFSALPGNHSLSVSGFAFNCDLTAAPTSTNVALGKTTRVDVQATCTPYLRNTIVYTSEEFGGAVMAMRPDGSRRVQLTTDQSVYAAPAVSPDGQTIAVAFGAWDGIYVLDRFGKGRTKLIGGGSFDGTPAWSPDGTKLAFRRLVHRLYGDVGRIFVVNRDGTGLRQLTPEPTNNNENPYDGDPSWSPDGTRVLFSRSGEMSFINLDGTGLVSTGVIGDSPSWSRDGTHITYQSINGGNEGIWVMDMSFTPHQITTPVQADQMPRWSPDGSQLVFARVEAGVFQIYKMKPDGSGVTKLSTSLKSDAWPNWSPTF